MTHLIRPDFDETSIPQSSGEFEARFTELENAIAAVDSTVDGLDATVDNLVYSKPYNVKEHGAIGNGVADDTSAIHLARDTAGTWGHLYFPDGTYKVSGLTANLTGQWWELAPGATLKLADETAAHVIYAAANNWKISGGTIDGNRDNQSSGVRRGISVEYGTGCEVIGVTVQNTYDAGIFFYRAHESCCIRNRVSNCRLVGISIRDTQRVLVVENYIDATGGAVASQSDAIAVVSSGVGQNVTGCRVLRNTILTGADNFGIEAQVTTGDMSYEIVVAENHVRFGAACSGAISVSGLQGCVIARNTIDVNGYAGDYGIEVPVGAYHNVNGNFIRGGTTLKHGIILDQTSSSVVEGNTIMGFSTAANSDGIYVGSSTANDARYNVIAANKIVLPADASVRGIWVQANHASADLNDNVFVGNQIEGNGYGTTTGIHLDQTAGTIDRTILIGNLARNCPSGGIAITNATNTHRLGNIVGSSSGPAQGRAVLSSGTVTVTTAEVVANDNITLTRVLAGGTSGHLSVGTIVAGTSFVINSSESGDTSTIFWEIVH